MNKYKDVFSGTIKDILHIVEENKHVLQHETNSAAGSKLFEVVCQNEVKFKKVDGRKQLEV
ncbi:hypothetical protein NQ314_006211 [Rhamnusium bicolor]|uniref:Uncharacterized protein n=1 Tax=Rhamnusium bicolor TaxID=1586634 RepID=A0AAV8Z9K1_9CUCU|nr:hypothetical protein NQ314_006211 [Rhamnusium bicolor]